MCRRPIYQCQVILNAFFPQYLFGACPFCEEPCHVSKSQRSAVLVLWACACILSILWYTKSGSCIDFPLDWPNPASKVGKWFWVSPRCSERLLRLQSSSCYAEGLPFAFFFWRIALGCLEEFVPPGPFHELGGGGDGPLWRKSSKKIGEHATSFLAFRRPGRRSHFVRTAAFSEEKEKHKGNFVRRQYLHVCMCNILQ